MMVNGTDHAQIVSSGSALRKKIDAVCAPHGADIEPLSNVRQTPMIDIVFASAQYVLPSQSNSTWKAEDQHVSEGLDDRLMGRGTKGDQDARA